jgi:hypothetical protein
MSKKPETIFAEKIDKDLKKTFGADVWVENIQQVGKRGTPDRLICLKGIFVALELKIESGVVDTLQLYKLVEIKKAGGKSFVVYPYTWNLVLEKLKAIYANV